MKLINQFILPVLAFGCAFISTASVAAENVATSEANAILFRIENIKPVENEDGLTDKCKFFITLYNRLDKDIKEVNMHLQWSDNIAAKYVIDQDKVVAVDNAKQAVTLVEKDIVLEKIPSHKQKSFEEYVDTDKCFLLLDQLTYKVDNCIAEGDKVVYKDNKLIGKGSCISNFNYINSKNPEYYSEFQDVPESVLEEQAKAAKQQELDEINQINENTVKSLQETVKILEEIK